MTMPTRLFGVAANFYVNVDDGKAMPMAEVVITTLETNYVADPTGHLVRSNSTESHRFHTSAKGLRDMAKNLAAYADEADAVAKSLGGKKKPAMLLDADDKPAPKQGA